MLLPVKLIPFSSRLPAAGRYLNTCHMTVSLRRLWFSAKKEFSVLCLLNELTADNMHCFVQIA